jgi:HAD superfamily hydrolase (TIGR01509 family)
MNHHTAASGLQVSIKAVVFDMDGLMLNTEDVFELAGQELLGRRGKEMTDRIRHRMIGRRPAEAFAALTELTGITEPVEDLMEETREIFAEIAKVHLACMPGLFDLLDRIEDRPLPRAVATSSPREYMESLLSRFDLLKRFQTTLTSEDVIRGKPDPEIYLSAAVRLNVEPSSMLVLEDSEVGTRAAAAAGAFVVAVPNQHTVFGDFSMASMRIDSLCSPELHSLIAQTAVQPNDAPQRIDPKN